MGFLCVQLHFGFLQHFADFSQTNLDLTYTSEQILLICIFIKFLNDLQTTRIVLSFHNFGSQRCQNDEGQSDHDFLFIYQEKIP